MKIPTTLKMTSLPHDPGSDWANTGKQIDRIETTQGSILLTHTHYWSHYELLECLSDLSFPHLFMSTSSSQPGWSSPVDNLLLVWIVMWIWRCGMQGGRLFMTLAPITVADFHFYTLRHQATLRRSLYQTFPGDHLVLSGDALVKPLDGPILQQGIKLLSSIRTLTPSSFLYRSSCHGLWNPHWSRERCSIPSLDNLSNHVSSFLS